ncbi:hypothetical protein KVR01_007989 [Diaporthe batatas]|uniref:uncharacterized protein n=1 Tax=Diaporthe batatas TaxID=748121 RepID=UPI001D045B2E|nr:uncharacterized protein KVR01_007989 [Diaporthe batatas]KAG8162224.1 hypothetical protein KVR01_007989 [Diaporthe batatas]
MLIPRNKFRDLVALQFCTALRSTLWAGCHSPQYPGRVLGQPSEPIIVYYSFKDQLRAACHLPEHFHGVHGSELRWLGTPGWTGDYLDRHTETVWCVQIKPTGSHDQIMSRTIHLVSKRLHPGAACLSPRLACSSQGDSQICAYPKGLPPSTPPLCGLQVTILVDTRSTCGRPRPCMQGGLHAVSPLHTRATCESPTRNTNVTPDATGLHVGVPRGPSYIEQFSSIPT